MLWCDQNSLSNGVYDERIWIFFKKILYLFWKFFCILGKFEIFTFSEKTEFYTPPAFAIY